jgi:hypothetical protein
MTIRNFYFFFSASKVGKAGLADVTVDVYAAADGSKVVNDQAATEIAGGFYKYGYSTITADDFLAAAKTDDATVDMKHVPALYKNLLQNLDATISSRATLGSGSVTKVYTVTRSDGITPMADVTVEVYTELAMSNIIAAGITDQYGHVTFYLDTGTVYLKRTKTGYTFTNPDTEVVA